MKIGIEAERANLPQKTGVEVYAAQLIKHLALLDQKNQYVLYFRTKPQEWFYQLPKNFELRVIPFPKFWTQIRISFETMTSKVDALMILASALPFYHPKKSVVTVHDVAWRLFPEAFTPFMRNYLEWSTRYAVNRAAKVVAVSNSTKNDLVKFYGIDPGKVEVIYLGKSEIFKPMTYEQAQPVLDKFGLTYQKYILFVGTLQPRKNILKLLEAFVILKRTYHIEEKLVIVGKHGWLWEPIEKKISDFIPKDSVKRLDFGTVKDDELPFLYSGAAVLTLPSLYEGFGLPPLEAMTSGVPVVVSNISSLPEVVGDAGMLVDPQSVDDIARGILDVLTNAGLRHDMIEKGLLQAQKFSWENTAQKTLELLSAIGGSASGGETLK